MADGREESSNADRWLIVGFVVLMAAALAALGWGYRPSTAPAPICGSAEARCADKTDPAQ